MRVEAFFGLDLFGSFCVKDKKNNQRKFGVASSFETVINHPLRMGGSGARRIPE
jgi:hypothetical protein